MLGRAGQLKLAPRSSSFAFKARELDVREIGRRLNVAHVLDGSVRRSEGALRVTVELIDVALGLTRWMNVYDGEAETLPQIQEDIAQHVVAEIRPEATDGAVAAIRVDHGTRSPAAYDAYLKGRFYWNSRYAVGLERSLECFGEAARLDPEYAAPLSGLADAFSLLAFYNFLSPREGFGKAADFTRPGPRPRTGARRDQCVARLASSTSMIGTTRLPRRATNARSRPIRTTVPRASGSHSCSLPSAAPPMRAPRSGQPAPPSLSRRSSTAARPTSTISWATT